MASAKNVTLPLLLIIGSGGSCKQGSQNAAAITNKYCGKYLTDLKDGEANIPICGMNKNLKFKKNKKVIQCFIRLHGAIYD